MVHGLAAQLGGGLTIESAVGQGTTISLWLPTSEIEAGRDAAGPDTAPVKLDHGLALVVDDEELVRASTVHMLRELGYDVLEASSAEHALAIIQAEPDLDVLRPEERRGGKESVSTRRSRWSQYS